MVNKRVQTVAALAASADWANAKWCFIAASRCYDTPVPCYRRRAKTDQEGRTQSCNGRPASWGPWNVNTTPFAGCCALHTESFPSIASSVVGFSPFVAPSEETDTVLTHSAAQHKLGHGLPHECRSPKTIQRPNQQHCDPGPVWRLPQRHQIWQEQLHTPGFIWQSRDGICTGLTCLRLRAGWQDPCRPPGWGPPTAACRLHALVAELHRLKPPECQESQLKLFLHCRHRPACSFFQQKFGKEGTVR